MFSIVATFCIRYRRFRHMSFYSSVGGSSVGDDGGYMDVLLQPRFRRLFRPLKLRHLMLRRCVLI